MTIPSDEYLRNAVMTATPEQLQLMLYDGATRFTRQGIDAIGRKDWEGAFNGLSRAQKIVLEMTNALNYDVDPELCKRTAALYNFIYRRLVEAGTQRNTKPAEEALEILVYQRETWVMLIEKVRQERVASEPEPAHSAPPVTVAPSTPAGTVRQPPRRRPPQFADDGVYGSLSVEG